MGSDILIGLLIIAAIGAIVWAVRHPPAPAAPAARHLSDTIKAASSETWEAVKADLPAIVSAEVSRLRSENASLVQELEKAKADRDAEAQASFVRLDAVKAQIAELIAGISGQPASGVIAATQAADAARVAAFADQISPAHPAPQA